MKKFQIISLETEKSITNRVDYLAIIQEGKGFLTAHEVLHAMAHGLAECLVAFLKTVDMRGYYMLWCAIHADPDDSDPFVFALVSTLLLSFRTASVKRYEKYLDQCDQDQQVMHIKSPSGTLLLSPCPGGRGNILGYGHIKEFLVRADADAVIAMFTAVATDTLALLRQGNDPVYVNTHGLDVPWLHIRLETPLPKHFHDFSATYEQIEHWRRLGKKNRKPKDNK